MNVTIDIQRLKSRLETFTPDTYAVSRCLGLFSAAITVVDRNCTEKAIRLSVANGADHTMLYEVVLQSYLFLGFPRMLIAAETLDRIIPDRGASPVTERIDRQESEDWFENGMKLYERVYDTSSTPLREKVETIAPDIFRWMIIEGYGKVLSRPGLGVVDRELSIVAFLMMENRDQQLYSHLRGALNVGAPRELVERLIEDIGHASGDGYQTALMMLRKLEAN